MSDLPIPNLAPNDQESWISSLELAFARPPTERLALSDEVVERRWVGGKAKLFWLDVLERSTLGEGVRLSAVCDRLAKFNRENKSFEWPNYMFDEQYYLETYPDVAEGIRDGHFASGIAHYTLIGKGEARSPSRFDSRRQPQDHLSEAISTLLTIDAELDATERRIKNLTRRVGK